jgi:hypothetical protein
MRLTVGHWLIALANGNTTNSAVLKNMDKSVGASPEACTEFLNTIGTIQYRWWKYSETYWE